MTDHIEKFHGVNWAPVAAAMTRADDQKEFVPCLTKTPWGSDLR